MNTQEILNTILVIGFLIITGCTVLLTYYFIKTLRSIKTLEEFLEDKIHMKALAVIPPLLIGIINKIFKKRG